MPKKTNPAQARREAEIQMLEPLIRAIEKRLANGAKWKKVAAQFNVQWRDFSRLGRVVTDRFKWGIECGAEWRRLCRDDDLHARAMAGDDHALLKLWERDRLRATAHDAHTR